MRDMFFYGALLRERAFQKKSKRCNGTRLGRPTEPRQRLGLCLSSVGLGHGRQARQEGRCPMPIAMGQARKAGGQTDST